MLNVELLFIKYMSPIPFFKLAIINCVSSGICLHTHVSSSHMQSTILATRG